MYCQLHFSLFLPGVIVSIYKATSARGARNISNKQNPDYFFLSFLGGENST